MAAPYSQGVNQYPYQRPRMDAGLLRDVVALALVFLGLAGLVTVAFAYDWRLGVAALSTVSVATGVYLGYER